MMQGRDPRCDEAVVLDVALVSHVMRKSVKIADQMALFCRMIHASYFLHKHKSGFLMM